MNDRDAIERLREAWRAVEPPERGDRLDEADPRTQATLRWMKDAWSTVTPAMPSRRRRGWRVLRPAPLAYAAAAFFLIAVGASFRFDPSPLDHGDHRAHRSESAGEVAVAVDETVGVVDVDEAIEEDPPAMSRDPIHHLIGVGLMAYGSALTSGLSPTPQPTIVSPTTMAHDVRMIRTIQRTRRGEWSEVTEAAHEVLRLKEATRSARCEALYQLALSFEFLGRRDESVAYRSRLERELAINR